MANPPNPFQSTQAPTLQEDQSAVGKKQRGTGFTNISRILGANVGAGQQMGSAIAQNIGSRAKGIQQNVASSAQQFKTQAEQAKEQALSGISTGVPFSNMQEGQVPTGLSGMTEDEAKNYYKKFQETKYGGPTQLAGATGLQSTGMGLTNIGQSALSGQLGQRNLLRSMVAGQSPYNRGQSVLDATLLGQSQQAQQAIKSAGQQALNVGQNVMSQANIAQNIAQQAEKNVEAQKQNIQSGLQSSLENTQSAAEKSGKDLYSQVGRIKDILTKTAADENVQLSDADKDILKNLSKYNPDLPNIKFDTSEESANKQILQAIANAGLTTGDVYNYTPEQKAAAKNLALMTGQTDLAKNIEASEFNKNLLPGAESATKGLTSGLDQKRNELLTRLNLNPNISNEELGSKSNLANTALKNKDTTSNAMLENYFNMHSYPKTEYALYDLIKRDTFLNQAAQTLGVPEVAKIMAQRYVGKDMHGFTEYGIGQLKNSVEDVLKNKASDLNQLYKRQTSTKTLQDYINEKFGLNK